MITHNLGMRSDYSAIRARQPKKDCRIMYYSTLTDAMPSWPTQHNTKCLILLTTLVPTADALQCPPWCVTPTAELFRHKIVMKKNWVQVRRLNPLLMVMSHLSYHIL